MAKIICIGSACKDVFFPTGEGKIIETPEDLLSQKKIQFELGAKYKIDERYESLGGCAANVAVGLAKLGVDSSCYSHLGNDRIADWIAEDLKSRGVGTDLISKDEMAASDMSAIIVDKNTGERVIFANQPANGNMKIENDKLEKAEWFFIGDLHGNWEDDLESIIEFAEEKKVKVVYNPRQINIHDDVQEILQAVAFSEVLILNKDEAMEIISAEHEKYSEVELKDEKFLLAKMKELGPIVVAITDGTNGAWVTDGEKKYWSPAIISEAIDTTGAGDAFTSGFSAAYINGKSIEECLKWGVVNSSNSVKFFGAVEGLLGENDIEKIIGSVKVEEII